MRFIILLIMLVFLAGCAGTFQPSEVCTGDSGSVILKITSGNPTGLDKALLMVNFAGLEKGTYTASDARKFLDDVQEKVESGITYVDLANWLKVSIENIPKYAGISMIVMGKEVPLIGQTGGTNPLSECDKELIYAHIAHQKQIIAFY